MVNANILQGAIAQQAEFIEDVSTITAMISEAQAKLKSAPQPEASDSLETLQQQLAEHRVHFWGFFLLMLWFIISSFTCFIASTQC